MEVFRRKTGRKFTRCEAVHILSEIIENPGCLLEVFGGFFQALDIIMITGASCVQQRSCEVIENRKLLEFGVVGATIFFRKGVTPFEETLDLALPGAEL